MDEYTKSDGKTRYFTGLCMKNCFNKIRTKMFIIPYMFNRFKKLGLIYVLHNQYCYQNHMYPKLTKND